MMPDKTQEYGQSYWRAPVVLPQSLDAGDPEDMAAEFRLLADFLPTLCWMAHGDGAIFWYNRRWHDYCGTTHDDMKGWGWQSVHDPDVLPEVMARWTAAVAHGSPFEMTFPLRGADGLFRPFITRVAPLRDASGTVARWIGVNTEITAQVRAEQALLASEAKYEVLTNAMPQMVWSTLPDGYHDYYNAQWYAFTGVPLGSTDGAGWNDMFHPDDQDLAWTRWRHSLATGEAYEIEYRLRHHSGEYRWVLGRALPVRTDNGTIIRWIGTCTDINDAKRAAESNELLSRELSHRIKNIFAVISGLINLSARRVPECKPFAATLLGRISALGRAHDFARPHSPSSRPKTNAGTLQGLLEQLFLPYAEAETPRIFVSGDDIPIDDQSATPIALVMHELATNSAKYGALSDSDGRLTIEMTRADDILTIAWQEFGGPPMAGPPTRTGFGSELAALSVERQLGGSIEKEWLPEGLKVTIRFDCGMLYRTD